MQAAYRSVTLEQLVQHRAGIREDLLLNPDLVNRMKEQGEDSTAQRAAYVEDVLGSPPIGEAGKESRYSNAGYAVAAYLGEVRTGESWEQLVRRTVFQPLEMATGSFGWPAKAQDPDAPYGHFGMPRQRRVQEFEDYDIGKFWRPAGDVACCLEDLARYAAGHIAGLRGEDGFLKAATVARLHTPLVDDPGGPYAAGWSVLTDRHGGTVHWHNGSAGTFLAEVLLFPDDNTALLFLSNAAGGIEPAIESLLLGSIADRLFRES
jgi:CubicO group peptidase (beta-lactamase class C family)